jgi:asparagine synthase (glutamine-hydrolysing)
MPLKNKENGRMIKQEKLILRDAFKNDDYLPVEILWRRKEAFSDGVSATTDSWYKKCADYALEKQCVSIGEYSHNPPKTAEAAWYRQIFELEYGSVSALTIPYMWLPRWTNTTDPSARTLAGIY